VHKPLNTLGFIIATSTILAAISIIFPSNGIRFTDTLSLKYPSFQELFLIEKTAKKDISGILALAAAEEKTDIRIKNDSITESPIDSIAKLNMIQKALWQIFLTHFQIYLMNLKA